MCFFGGWKIHFGSQAMSNFCDIKHETKNKLYNDDPEKIELFHLCQERSDVPTFIQSTIFVHFVIYCCL